MLIFRHSIILLLAVFVMLFAGMQSAQAQHGLPDFADLVKEAGAAVVNISTTQKIQTGMPELPEGFEIPELPEGSPFGDLFKHFFERGDGEPKYRDAKSLGSGFIISSDGYIITNHHVVKNADEVIVRLNDRRELLARIIGMDKRSDIALLKVDADHLPVVKIGKSSDLTVGSWVLAIGSPFGFDSSATAGIVSAKGRSLPGGNYVPFIQTDVAINPGNSGGPLFNLEGEVVGVNSQIYSRTGGYMGLSFAIPIAMAMDVVEQLKSSGRVSRGWLGVLIQDVTYNLGESFGMEQPRGALVARVVPDGPAESSGIQVGDVILSFNGHGIVRSSDLPPVVGGTRVGEDVPVEIMRNRKKKFITVRLGELPDEVAEIEVEKKKVVERTGRLGISVVELTNEQKEALDLESGVLVGRVVDGAAYDAGIRKGDVIVRIDNKPISSLSQFEKLVNKLPEGKTVPVLVQRGNSPIFFALKIVAED